MTAQAFLLYMNLVRISLMIGAICWLIFTAADREQLRRVLLLICLFMLASNLINATVAIGILHVRLF